MSPSSEYCPSQNVINSANGTLLPPTTRVNPPSACRQSIWRRLLPLAIPISHRSALAVCLPVRRNPRLTAMNRHTKSALHCHWINRLAETGTLLMSLSLSQTMNDTALRVVAGTVCTGITHSCSHPGQMALAAGRALATILCDCIVLTASDGH